VNPVRDHSKDTYPAFYRLNTRGALRKYFPSPDFEDRSYLPFADAAYFGRSGLLRRVWNAWIRWGPIATRPYLHIFLKKEG